MGEVEGGRVEMEHMKIKSGGLGSLIGSVYLFELFKSKPIINLIACSTSTRNLPLPPQLPKRYLVTHTAPFHHQ
jgi:hypothetical protein